MINDDVRALIGELAESVGSADGPDTDTLVAMRGLIDTLNKWAAESDRARAERKSSATPPPVAEPRPNLLAGDMEQLVSFLEEANEHLHHSDVQLLTLESSPHDADALNAVFRAFHSIKGLAGFMALAEVEKLAHKSEDLLDMARKGKIDLSGPTIDVIFDAVDMLKRISADCQAAIATDGILPKPAGLDELLGRIEAVRTCRKLPPAKIMNAEPGQLIGEVLVDAGAATEGSIDQALETAAGLPEPKKLGQILVESNITTSSRVATALYEQAKVSEHSRLGELMVTSGAVSEAEVAEAVRKQQEPPQPVKLGEQLVRDGAVAARDVARAIRGQRAAGADSRVRESVRVDAERLARLADGIAELITVESMVSQSKDVRKVGSPDLSRLLEQLDCIARKLQRICTSLRMVPIRPTFQRMARLARDLGKKAGKQVQLIMVGEDTELDRAIVKKLGDPLFHMVRNAVDHGIEPTAEARRAAGKPVQAEVTLRAFHKGSNIHVEIQDDGRGLDRDAILARAIERGLVHKNENRMDREILALIFDAGFSTVEKVTGVSGRGVGLDVVRQNVAALGGVVDIQSEPGVGALFSIRIPLKHRRDDPF